MNGITKTKNILDTTTALIETTEAGGASRGTGFMFAINMGENDIAPLLITNKHVLKDAKKLSIKFSLSSLSDHTQKIGIAEYILQEGLNSIVFEHPDSDIDLAAINIAALLQNLTDSGYSGHGNMFSENDIAEKEILSTLGLAETVVMVGYPTGLSDEKHNLPIIRQGTLASDPKIDFNGRRHFVIDCACFPGSSGSPVVLKETQSIHEDQGNLIFKRRPNKLIGILYAGPIHTSKGKIVIRNIPSNADDFAQVDHMINLGYVIPAKHILALKNMMTLRPAGQTINFNRTITMF
ncbi:serine protease [Pseudomonas sp. GL93]|uniref:S1 family peptidase n=1 Tax=unclassified Pseudomonas TaxID=196821 RepID=UPI000E30EBBB|nr:MULTISPECIES: serine protease [unclassified Pseudomonas]RFD33861.1 serine protease [Pseudomonas sp. GL93]